MKKNKLLLFLLVSTASLLLSMDNKNTGASAENTRNHLLCLYNSNRNNKKIDAASNLSSEHQVNSWLTELPDEIIEKILSYEGVDIPEISQTNKRLYYIAKAHLNKIWKVLKTQEQNKFISRIMESTEASEKTSIKAGHFFKLYKRLLGLNEQANLKNGTTDATNPAKLLEIAEKTQDKNLRTIWQKAARALEKIGVDLAITNADGSRIDSYDYDTNQIRNWLHDKHNQPIIKQIIKLDLSNWLEDLPEEISLFTALQKLYSPSSNTPDTLTTLQKLTIQYNQNSREITIPETLTALKHLYIFNCKLKEVTIPCALTTLQTLDIKSSELLSREITIPETLTALKHLRIHSCALQEVTIPCTLTALKKLDISYIHSLRAMNIPETFTTLQVLNLSGNHLTEINIPDALIALEDLNLSANRLRKINVPKTFTTLKTLDLAVNNLIEINIPNTLTALQTLNLFCNIVNKMNIPATFTNLQKVNLEETRLREVTIPNTLISLQVLDLRKNQLRAVSVPDTLTALKSLDTSDNQLTSDSIIIPQEIRQISGIQIIGDDYLGLEDDLGLSCTIS